MTTHRTRTRLAATSCLAATMLGLGAGSVLAQQAFNVGAVPTGTGWFFGVAEAARVMSANTDYELTVRETGGTAENALRLTRGELDLAFTEALVGYELYRGEGRFEATPNDQVRLIYWLAPSTMHWAVREDSGIESFEDLQGMPFNPSSIGGGGEYITEQVFRILDIQPDFQRMRIDDAAEGVIDGRLVGFSYNGIPPIPAFTEVHSNRPLRLLSLDDDQVQAITDELPFLSAATIPAETYRGMGEATTMSIYMGLAANAGLSEDIVYEITRAFWENHDEIAAAFAPAEGMTPQDTIDNATFPLHAGAIRYYEEIGLEIPEDLIPPEMN